VSFPLEPVGEASKDEVRWGNFLLVKVPFCASILSVGR